MNLKSNLLPIWTNFYLNPDCNEILLINHSIYDFDNEVFAIGGLSWYNNSYLEGPHPTYLSLKLSGVPNHLVLHNKKKSHISTYMAQYPDKKEYLLHNYNYLNSNNKDIQLIKTDLSGRADVLCEEIVKVEQLKTKTDPKRDEYERKNFGKFIKLDLKEIKIEPKIIPCSQFSNNKSNNTASTQDQKIHMTLLGEKTRIFPSVISTDFNDNLTALVNLNNVGLVQIKVFDNVGKLIHEKNFEGIEGVNETTIPTNILPIGMAHIVISVNSDQILKTHKISRIY